MRKREECARSPSHWNWKCVPFVSLCREKEEMLTRHASLHPLSSWPVWLGVLVGQPVCLPAHTTGALATHSIHAANKFHLAATLPQFQAVASEV